MTEFIVHVPEPWSPNAVFLAADHPDFGSWRAHGMPMWRAEDGTLRVRWRAPAGTKLKCLVTRGHWRNAEVDEHGLEVPPRSITPEDGSHFVLNVKRWGRESVRYHHNFHSEFVTFSRLVSVWLPPGYGQTTQRYPVLYMHDGQNLFDGETSFAGFPWGCDEIAEQAIRAGECTPFIIVGVANTPDRIHEYGPRRCGPARGEDQSRQYSRFLLESVKPFIDLHYNTLPDARHTGVGGSSMGGLISLHLCKWHPRVFGICMAMSPALWWQREYFLRNVRTYSTWAKTCRVGFDMGGREGMTPTVMTSNVRRARLLAKHLAKLMPDGGLKYVEDKPGGHDERAWGTRFAPAIRFLFPPKRSNAG